jgi:cell division protein FtsI (penicillin-binding protein 3)
MSEVARSRLRLVLIATLLIWTCFLLRLGNLQIVHGGTYRKVAREQQRKLIPVRPYRGSIFDRKGRLLAGTVSGYSVFAFPPQVEDPQAAADALGRLGLGSYSRLTSRLSQGDFAWLARDVTEELWSRVTDLSLPGVYGCREHRRRYPRGDLAGNLLGFVGEDSEGLEGIEYRYDTLLGGTQGWAALHRTPAGKLYALPECLREPESEACNLFLTIDADIQAICEDELAKAVDRFDAHSGTAIVLEVETGEILAMATNPTWDPNRGGNGKAARWRNRAVTDMLEPGSTFKVVGITAALNEGLVTPEDVVEDGTGAIEIANHEIEDPHPHGPLTLREAVERSSNVAAVRVTRRLGKSTFYQYIRAFGCGCLTGIDLPGEARGLLSEPHEWSDLRFATMAIGQGVAVTPLQLSLIYSVLANDGILMHPVIVKRIDSRDGQTIAEASPQMVRNVVSSETARTMTDLLAGVVERGTGRRARIEGLSIAGKTGTAQKSVDGNYRNGCLVTSFVEYLPTEDPKLLVAIVIDEPKGIRYSSEVTPTVVRQIIERVIAIPVYAQMVMEPAVMAQLEGTFSPLKMACGAAPSSESTD